MWTLTACHRLEGQNFPFSRIVLRSWHNCGAAEPSQCLEPRVFWVEQRLNSRLLWEGLLTLNFKKAPFVVALMLLPVLVLGGQAAVGTRGPAWTAARLPLR